MPWTRNAHVAELARLLLEDADELLADDLALRLRVGDAGEPGEEPLLGAHVDERDVEVAAERLDDLLGLVRAHQPVVDEDARELVADRLVDEQRRDGRVDAAGEPADDALRADLRADPLDLLLDHRGGRPASAARRRPRRGSSSGSPAPRACARPPGGTGRRRGRGPRSSNAAIGVDGDEAVTRAPGGGAVTESRWLIQTTCSGGRSRKSADSPSVASALPYSETSFDSTAPPRSRAISCIP